MNRRRRRKLGVSTVIANMLMISITLALAAILVAWTGTTYGAFSSGSQIYFVQRGQALQERFVVEAEFFVKNATFPHTIRIFVRNVGAEEVSIVGIYINTASSQRSFIPATALVTGPCIASTQSVTIPVSVACEFDLDWGETWASGTLFNTAVTSARGNRAVFTARGL